MVIEAATAFLNQIAFVNAVLGGFAIALAVGLLAVPAERRSATWAAGLAAGAALALLLGTVGVVSMI